MHLAEPDPISQRIRARHGSRSKRLVMTTQSEEQRTAQREPQPLPVPPPPASIPLDDDLEPYNLPFTD
jgi:hypothetical protein